MQEPSEEAMRAIMADLNRTLTDSIEAQRRLVEITGTAWSDDRLVKVVVGPRGQLVELTLDPRLSQRSNMAALARTILSVAEAATAQAMAQAKEIIDADLPSSQDFLAAALPGGFDLSDLALTQDAELRRILGTDDSDSDRHSDRRRDDYY